MRKLVGYAIYEGNRIEDENVYQFIKKHSRLIDRLNPRKMTEMAIYGELVLFGVYKSIGLTADTDCKFYAKDGILDRIKYSKNEMKV